VAEHSVRVSLLCRPDDALWGLLHDASEAFLTDVPAPPIHTQSETRLMASAQFRGGAGAAPPAGPRALALAGAETGSYFSTPGGKDHGAQRSGPCASGNEVFALRDKTGTRQCLVAVTRIRLNCESSPTAIKGRWHYTRTPS
jgi:hypothetical protein